MAKINLLPWREERRRQQQVEFLTGIGTAAGVTLLILGGVHLYCSSLISHQKDRNQVLQDEITVLNKKIDEIKSIEAKKAKLMTKMELIQGLQLSRPQIVHLFEELPRTAPEGIHLTQFVQAGKKLTFKGKAQSNARVSAYMKMIEASSWLANPKLQVIQSRHKKTNLDMSDFTLFAELGIDKKAEANKRGKL